MIRDRVALFHCYNTVGNKWHKWEPHPKHVEEMPFKRQTLFRPVHCQDNTPHSMRCRIFNYTLRFGKVDLYISHASPYI